jgi:RNA-directed DNA polymerase
MRTHYPKVPFERYADDIVIHFKYCDDANKFKKQLETRLQECKLELHPTKTKIVYCKDDDRTAAFPIIRFEFLGYEFRPRGSIGKGGKTFCNFLPAVSRRAMTKMKGTVRAWRLKWCCEKSLKALSNMFNPIARGWIQYYGKYYKSALFPLAEQINRHLVKWVENKYKNFRRKQRRAMYALGKMARKKTNLFAHWKRAV